MREVTAVNEKMEVIEEVGEIEYWRETMTQTNSLRYRGGWRPTAIVMWTA